MSGWKTTALVVVLALSLLGNALAIGAGLRIYTLRQAMLGDSAAVTLPRAVRRDLVAALVSHKADMAPALRAVQAARGAAVAALVAKPYDADKAAQALDSLRSAVDGLMRAGQGIVLDHLANRN